MAATQPAPPPSPRWSGRRVVAVMAASMAALVALVLASFWVASRAGPGTQTLEWEVEHGRWGVAVMNAEGGR